MENVETPKTEDLRKMPYSELKQLAKKHGIKGNMKAEKIIAALGFLNSDEGSFSTPTQIEINSSKKNKEKKFDEDHLTPLATPRRGTFLVNPSMTAEEEKKLNDQEIAGSSPSKSPSVKATPYSPSASITFDSSLQADISTSSYAFNGTLDLSNITYCRGSERKLRPRKVSFTSPLKKSSTPKNANIRLRPKTPVASRLSLRKRVSFSTPPKQRKKKSSEKMRTTPHPRSSTRKHSTLSGVSFVNDALPEDELPVNQESSGIQESVKSVVDQMCEDGEKSTLSSNSFVKDVSDAQLEVQLPLNQEVKNSEIQENMKSAEVQLLQNSEISSTTNSCLIREDKAVEQTQMKTPGSMKSREIKSEKSVKLTPFSTAPGSVKSNGIVNDKSAKKTPFSKAPDFKKIHEEAFKKMESIDDYQKRKLINSEKKINKRPNLRSKVSKDKSKIPVHSGIPFIIPDKSNAFCKISNQDSKKKQIAKAIGSAEPFIFGSAKCAKVETAGKRMIMNENKLQSSNKKFDLKTSLSRKLGYIPHKGPLKPLGDSNNVACFHKEPANKVVNENRIKTRSVIKGVRTNRRFELQMQNRKL